MTNSICIFEDTNYNRLLPLVYLRPVYDLRCGILTLQEKIQRFYPNVPASLHCRSYLADVVKQHNANISVNEVNAQKCLFINGRVLADEQFAQKISLDGEDTIFVSDQAVIAIRASGSMLQSLKRLLSSPFKASDIKDMPQKEVNVNLINYPWDLISHNGSQIAADFKILTGSMKTGNIKGKVYEGSYLLNKENIFINEGTKIKPGVVLDAENGPIYLGKNATIFPNATIEGPAFVGNNSLIKIGAKIYGNTSIGEMCKVGGEVEASIIHSYSNKQHDGYLGHSYLGLWVNLGADTNNSDLKNNYGSIKVYVNGEMVDSGSMFVGIIMGDHSKSGINTMFNTGTVVGISSNVYGADFPPKFIPSFCWGDAKSFMTFDLEKSVDVAKRVMARRNIELTTADEQLFRKIFDLTKTERSEVLKVK